LETLIKTTKLKEIIQLARPHQYIKNFFIFLPIFFSLNITNIHYLLSSIIAFIAFSLTASGIYILNDLNDIEEDKQHPKKKYRPLASGSIEVPEALIAMGIFLSAGILLMGVLNINTLFILLIYILLNIGYTYYLKNVAIIDVVIIAIGFILRLFVGATVTGITLSSWIVIMTFLLALFMALAKRRDDIIIYQRTGQKMRKVIHGYNLQFLDLAMGVMATIVIIAYIMYISSVEHITNKSKYLYLTVFFVIIGILKYLQLSLVLENSGSPTKIVLENHFIQLTLLSWILTFFWILY